MFELFVQGGDAILVREVEPHVAVDMQQTRDRLNTLADETDYVTKRKVSNRNLYALTDAGEAHIIAAVRELID